MAFPILIVLVTSVLSGCVSENHEWKVYGSDRGVYIKTNHWYLLPKAHCRPVVESERPGAIKRLADVDHVTLEEAEIAALTGKGDWPREKHLKPYLVRGVAHSAYQTFEAVRFDRATGQLVVHHGTVFIEMFPAPHMVGDVVAFPVVVLLPQPPIAVYPTAVSAGDRAFGAWAALRQEREARGEDLTDDDEIR